MSIAGPLPSDVGRCPDCGGPIAYCVDGEDARGLTVMLSCIDDCDGPGLQMDWQRIFDRARWWVNVANKPKAAPKEASRDLQPPIPISGQITTETGSTVIRVLKGGAPVPEQVPFSDAAAAVLSDLIKNTDWPDGLNSVIAKASVRKARRPRSS